MPAHVDTPLDFSTWYHTDGTARINQSSSAAPSTTSSSSDSPSSLSDTINSTTTCIQPSKIGLSPTARRPRELRVKDDHARATAPHAQSASRERRISIGSRTGDSPAVVAPAPIVMVGPGIKPPPTPSQLRPREHAARVRPKRANGHERSHTAPAGPAKTEATPRREQMLSAASEPSSQKDTTHTAPPVKLLLPAAQIVAASAERPRALLRRKPSPAHGMISSSDMTKTEDISVEEQLRRWEAMHRAALSLASVPPPPRTPVHRAPARVPDNTPTSSALVYEHNQVFDPADVAAALKERERARHAARVGTATLESAQSIRGMPLNAQKRATPTPKVLSSPRNASKENYSRDAHAYKELPATAKEAWEEPGAKWYLTAPSSVGAVGLAESADNTPKQLQSWYRPAPKKESKPAGQRKGWLTRLF